MGDKRVASARGREMATEPHASCLNWQEELAALCEALYPVPYDLHPAPATACPVEASCLDWREELVALYRAHNPSKLADVDALLEKYQGKEAQFIDAVRKKALTELRTLMRKVPRAFLMCFRRN